MVTLRNREVEDAKEGMSDGNEIVENDEPSNSQRDAGKDATGVKSGDKAKKGKIDSKLLARAEFLQSMLLFDTSLFSSWLTVSLLIRNLSSSFFVYANSAG